MNHLATILPAAGKRRLPVSRDQAMLLMAAVNEIALGLDAYLAHVLNNAIQAREWIPILFGPIAGILLLIAGIISQRKRNLASSLASIVLLASIIVGLLGAYFHIVRGSLPSAPIGERFTVGLLVWAPPILAPFSFALVGLLGISAAWIENPIDSGSLALPFGKKLRLPYSKTRAYFYMVSMGILIALISSTLDHSRHPWENPWLWLPFSVGIFGVVVSAGMAVLKRPSRTDLITYLGAMILLLIVGAIGAVLHVDKDLIAQTVIIPERFLRGAPVMAPLLFANMGLIGILALLNPYEEPG
ncbi:MAG: hypothetical protein ACE5EY_07270 [Anaerolineae bacterium]